MSQTVEILGTLRPDGTILLDEKPSFPASRVRVVLETVSTPAAKDPLGVRLVQGCKRR